MLGEKYTLDIRPTFIDELDRAVAYIEQHLLNPIAADKLVSDVYEAIDQTLAHPLVTAPRYSPPDVRQPYYAIQVGNYTVYYIVHDHIMEVLLLGIACPKASSFIEKTMRELGRRIKKLAYNWKEAGLNKVSSILLKIFASNEEWEKYWKERMDLNQKVMLSFKLQKHLCR